MHILALEYFIFLLWDPSVLFYALRWVHGWSGWEIGRGSRWGEMCAILTVSQPILGFLNSVGLLFGRLVLSGVWGVSWLALWVMSLARPGVRCGLVTRYPVCPLPPVHNSVSLLDIITTLNSILIETLLPLPGRFMTTTTLFLVLPLLGGCALQVTLDSCFLQWTRNMVGDCSVNFLICLAVHSGQQT